MRIQKSLKNLTHSLIGQVISILLSFLNRTFFIKILGIQYLGINSLFTDILSMLSLAELGVGTAITFALYKPLASKDKNMISSIMNLYSKLYKYIGILIGVIGVTIVPFLNIIIKEKGGIENIVIIYLLFLFNSVISYFFTFKRTILIADQKQYINIKNIYVYQVIQYFLQIGILIISKSFILYLLIQIICTILSNFSISRKVDKLYPYLNENKNLKICISQKKQIFKNTGAMIFHKIGSIVVSGTDNILLSSLVSISSVGLYSNYKLLTNTLNTLIMQIYNAVTASVGNLNAEETIEKSYRVFSIMQFVSFWIYGFCSCCLMVLLNPFIEIWLGKEYILSPLIVFFLVVLFFITGMRQTSIVFINTMGLFWQLRYKSLFEAIINLVVSIILISRFGLLGVIVGTIISTVCTNVWMEPYVVYNNGFNLSFKSYLIMYIKYFFIAIGTVVGVYVINTYFKGNQYFIFIIKFLVSFILSNLLFILFFSKSYEYKEIKRIILCVLKRSN
ncbi:lipopolysaccharide biosynthesis protein [Clostridium perfringens]|uniref:lipopolysaccharide biosynthesis protein n=3 Tax=Clostridium perfringens TaxID=1502 RepID=UPI0018E4807E|nr:sugar translocase [Clostridium perfringens]MBI6036999.1 sugar translocase [Clostridium perfringens]MDK0598017.1 sugar translocase [Clostridium perfringens]MDK0945220.1 sugar translocase [Clostridium perfringens]MDK0962005.1 sugar translocase [Clostridium perfringens]MDK0964979.1 sugar translocase [Clostridium perfringens]